MIQASIDEINVSHLTALVANEVRERRDLEFKRELPASGDTQAKEFLADVTAMANAQGGDIVYGIEERNGVASAVPGIAVVDLDAEVLRIESRIRDGVEPRLMGVRVRWVDVGNGRGAVVLRVPASFAAPHCARHSGSRRFFSRSSNGKYEMDTQELRHAFTSADQLPDRVRALHRAAVQASTGSALPFGIDTAPSTILSVMPLSIFREQRDLPITVENAIMFHHPEGRVRGLHMLEGVLLHSPVNEDTSEQAQSNVVRSYALTHWQGRVDAAWKIGRVVEFKEQRNLVWPENFEGGVMNIARATVARLREFAIDGPWVILATVRGIKDFELVLDNQRTTEATWRDGGTLPEIVVDEVEEVSLTPLFRSFWLLFGTPRPANRKQGVPI